MSWDSPRLKLIFVFDTNSISIFVSSLRLIKSRKEGVHKADPLFTCAKEILGYWDGPVHLGWDSPNSTITGFSKVSKWYEHLGR